MLNAYNDAIRRCAASHERVHVVDVHDAFLGHGIHCTQFWSRHYNGKDPHYWYYSNLEDPNERGYNVFRAFLLEMSQVAGQLPGINLDPPKCLCPIKSPRCSTASTSGTKSCCSNGRRSPIAASGARAAANCTPTSANPPMPAPAAKRKEELGVGLEPSDLHLTGIVSEHGYQGQSHWLMFLFEVKPQTDGAPAAAPRRTLQFFATRELERLNLPADRSRNHLAVVLAISRRLLCRALPLPSGRAERLDAGRFRQW